MSDKNYKHSSDKKVKFAFSKANQERVKTAINKYPEGKEASAVMELLHIAQEQEGWVSIDAMDHIASMLGMPAMAVYEVANFYTMYNKAPVGKYLLQICRTMPCKLRGGDVILEVLQEKLGIDVGETTVDNLFTVTEVECLGACVNGPILQINDDYFEDLNKEHVTAIIDNLIQGKEITPGSCMKRHASEPINSSIASSQTHAKGTATKSKKNPL